MKCTELRAELVRRGMSQGGTKAQLELRLKEAKEKEERGTFEEEILTEKKEEELMNAKEEEAMDKMTEDEKDEEMAKEKEGKMDEMARDENEEEMEEVKTEMELAWKEKVAEFNLSRAAE